MAALRFRSISFSVPTTDFAAPSEEAASAATRRRERARKFRELQGEQPAPTDRPLLTAQQKRKVAYINQELNEKADAVNAYVRLGEPRLAAAHGDEEPELDERLTGPVLAALVAGTVDNSVFDGRHLRADVVVPLAPHEIIAAGLDKQRTADGSYIGAGAAGAHDPKRTVFVGNLDFEAHEEELRELFERLVREERGNPPADLHAAPLRLDSQPCEEDSAVAQAFRELHPPEWVQSVRIVRDRATQLGKGFAYVKFLDPQCVDELVAIHEAEEAFIAAARPGRANAPAKPAKTVQLEEGQEFRRRLKLRKRALRVSRCKAGGKRGRDEPQTAPGRPAVPAKRGAPGNDAGARSNKKRAPVPIKAPDAAAASERAAYLATLSKEQRAMFKKNDPERQARRMQKKQNKSAQQKAADALGKGRERVKLPQKSQAKRAVGTKKK